MSCENALLVIFKFSARPSNSLWSRFVWAVKFVLLDCKLANVAGGGVIIPLDLNSWISFKMLKNKCVIVVLRAQWLVTIEGSWEKVGDSSLVQCKTRFGQIFHIFFSMKQIFVDPSPKLVTRSCSVLRRGRFGYKITSPPSHSLSQLFMNTFCFITKRASLLLSQTISAIKCCSGWDFICFHSRLQLFPEEPGVDRQNDVVDRVTVSDPHLILQRLRLYG